MISALAPEALRCIFLWLHPRCAARLARAALSLAVAWREPALRIDAICRLCRDADRRSAALARSTRRRLISQRVLANLCLTPRVTELARVLLDIRCNETRRRVLQAIGQLDAEGEAFTPMVVDRLSDPDATVRRQAISTLEQLGTVASSTNMLVSCLRDQDPLVRETSVQTLAPFVNADCAGAFADCLNDKSEKVRKMVGKLLPGLLSKNVEIAAALLHHDSALARRDAAVALGIQGKAAAPWADQLASCLRDADGRVRRASAKALTMCGFADSFAVQLAALLRDPDASEEAFRGLETVHISDIQAQGSEGSLVAELAQTLSCPRLAPRDNAISLLLRLGSSGLQVGVSSMHSPSPLVRAASASLLGQFGLVAHQWIEDIASLLDDKDTTVRKEATEAITSICLKDPPDFVLKKLGSMIDDESSAVSASVLLSLRRLQSVAEYSSVVALRLRSGDAHVRAAAASALAGEWGSPFILDVAALLDDEDPLVRKACLDALGRIGIASTSHGTGIAEALAKTVFQDPFAELRRIACDILGHLCGDSGMTAVAKHCGVEDIRGCWVTIVSGGSRWVLDSGERCRKMSILSSLGQVGIPFASIVADQLCDHDWDVRAAAARALASLGAADFAPRLLALVRPGIPVFFRSAVTEALQTLGYSIDVIMESECKHRDHNEVSDPSSDSGPEPIWNV